MPSYFDNLQDTEISGGEFTSVGGDFVGTNGVRQGGGGPKGKSEPVSYFANGKGLKITGGNFMSFGGDFYAGHTRSPPVPIAPTRPAPVPLAPQYDNYGGYTHSRPSTPQRPATYYDPTASSEQGITFLLLGYDPWPDQSLIPAPYNHYGEEYGNPAGSQSTGMIPPQ